MTPKTLAKERKKKFEAVIFSSELYAMAEEDQFAGKEERVNAVKTLAALLAEAAQSRSETMTIENAIALDIPVTQEMADTASLKDTAPKMFEAALGFKKPLPWWSNKEWTAFAEWVCEEYSKSKTAFGEYNIWRFTPYIKGGIANTRLRGFPAEFYDSWDMFMMSKPVVTNTREEGQSSGYFA